MKQAYLGKSIRLYAVVLMLAISAVPAAVSAETRYVSDILYVSMRAEPDDDADIIQTLRSDTPLEILEETEEYVRVRLESGDEGWVVKRYVTSNIPKAQVITELGEKINRLEVRLEEMAREKTGLAQELQTIRENRNQSVGEYKSTIEEERREARKIQQELESVTQKYDQLLSRSQNVVQLSDKMKKLEKENIQLRIAKTKNAEMIRQLEAEKKKLLRAAIIRWFLAGSGVLLVGVILGKLSRKKDYY